MRFTVVGDLIVDEYIHIHAGGEPHSEVRRGRKYQELATSPQYRLGGAGAVANLIRHMGHDVVLVAAIGGDHYGHVALQLCDAAGIGYVLAWTASSKTSCKMRGIHNYEDGKFRMAPTRIDRDWPAEILDADRQNLAREVTEAKNLVVADYGKGVVDAVLTEIHDRDFEAGWTLIDPCRDRDWRHYGRCDLIKVNYDELMHQAKRRDVSGGKVVESSQALASAAIGGAGPDAVVVTLGEDGLIFCVQAKDGRKCEWVDGLDVPVVDVTGAGDTVMAALAVSLVGSESLRSACQIANRCAAEQVQTLGVNPVALGLDMTPTRSMPTEGEQDKQPAA